jgi:hypothetical protein
MTVIAAPVATHTTHSPSLVVLVVIIVLAAVVISGRRYVNRRSNRRDWK